MTVQRIETGTGFAKREVFALTGSFSDICDTLHAASAAAIETHLANVESPECTRLARSVRAALQRNDAAEAARYAFRLGALVREIDLKSEWEAHALRGAACVEGAARGGQGKRGSTLDRDIAASIDFEKRKTAKRELAVIRVTQSKIITEMLKGKDYALSKNGLIAAIKRGDLHRFPARKKQSTQGGKVD